MKTTTFTIKSLTALIMHNGRLADPLDEHTKRLAKLTSSKQKTEKYHREISEAEWYGSLYTDEDEEPCLPGEVLESMLVEGAKKYKLGKAAKGAIIVTGDFKLVYDGPKKLAALWSHGGFLKRAGVRVGQSRIIRSRPCFPKWECTFTIQWDPDLIKDEDQLAEIVEASGLTGVGDWRPKFGRFEVIA
jgi:hypothetical protein